MSLMVLAHEACAGHRPPPGHPECPERLLAARRGVDQIPGIEWLSARSVSPKELARAHCPAYLNELENIAACGALTAIDSDTYLGPGSLPAAAHAAGAICQAIDLMTADRRRPRAFAMVRPPGHHAEAQRAMGFCLYSSVAIGALHAAEGHRLQRIAVCDFDVHHGNGSQAILEGDARFLFVSSHQHPLYPGTGRPHDPHEDNVLNCALPPGSGSNEFRDAWIARLLPEIDRFQPDLILVSAGFDAHWRDPLAQLTLKDEDFFWIGEQLKHLAISHAQGRLVASLEGGYDLHALETAALAFAEGIA